MKNYLRFVFFIFLFSFFGCSGSVDENLYSSVSFEITIPESIGKQDSKIARSATTEELTLVVNLEIQGSDKLRTIEKNVSPGDTVTISFDEIPVESNIRVKGELSNADDVLLYSGKSEWQIVFSGKNSVELKMKKVITDDDNTGGDNTGDGGNTEGGGDNTGDGGNTEGGGDNTGDGDNTGNGDNTEGGETPEAPEEIVNAEKPLVVTSPNSIVDLLYGLDTENPVLQISAKSEDGGVVSFQWQVKNASGEWEVVESITTENAALFNCSLTVPLDSISLNETKSYKCIVTNTNETVNGIKTAFVEVPVEVSLKQGTVLKFTTDYSGTYELYGKEFGSSDNKDYSSIKIVEYYTRPNGNQESRMVSFDGNRYNIASVQNAVGYVPYTITNITSKVTSEVRVPVKYSLEKATVSVLNSSGSAESSIAQYTGTEKLTANIELPSSDSESNDILLYSSTETTTPSNFLINENVKVIWSAGTVCESQLSVVVDNTESKTYKATVTPKEENSWCAGEIVSNEYSVTVEPWIIEVDNSKLIDGKYVIDINAKECVLLATNSAYPEPTVFFESENNKFNIDENVVHISTSENTIEDVIIAKVDEIFIGSISIILPGITNAAEPLLVGDFESKELIYPVDTEDPVLNISAKSTDGGVITFQWKVQNANGEWEDVEVTNSEPEGDVYTSSLTVPLSLFDSNETKTYKCIVTNTNDKVNGNKTASVTKTATIAYVEGKLSTMTAEYKNDCYEIFGTDFTYENINVTEEWISGENSFKFTIPASNTRYEVKQNSTTGESVIGAVPYTITYIGENANTEKPLSQKLTIPVKYQLKTTDLQLSSYFNDSYVSTSEDDKTLKVPQYGTVKYGLTLPESVGGSLTIIKADGTTVPIKDLTSSADYYSTTIYKDGTLIENDASCEVAGVYKYKLAIKSENEWFVCEENNTKEFDVEVCTWNMSVTGTTKNDSGEFVLNDTSTPQCSVSATNEAISNITVSFYDGDTELTGGTFVVYAQSTTQRKEIIAKVGTIEVGTVVVIIPGHEAGSISNPITSWGDLVTAMQNEGGDIYIKGSLTADSTLNIEKDRAIIADGAVTITRDQNFNGTLFNVNNNFVLKGENANSSITIDGNGVSAENTIISTNYNVSLEYVTMTNCNSTSDNGIIDVSNSEILSLKNCSFIENSINNTVYISGENIEATIENCSFSDSCVDLSIINANIVSINNSSFDQDNINNLSITKCPTLELGENLKIPLIYYNNSDVTNSELDILCKDTYLSDENIPIYLRLVKYENDEASYDLDLFADNQNIPNSVFAIDDSNYVLNTSTGVVEPVSSGESGSESSNAVVDFTTLQTAINNANGTETDPYVIKIAANDAGLIDIIESITIQSHIKLVPAGNTDVKLGRNYSIIENNLFVIKENASLTLGDSSASASIIIDGGSETNMNAKLSLIKVESGGTLVLNEKSTLQNNLCYGSNGSAVYSKGGTIKIDGGVISSNQINDTSSARYGGGIYLDSGTFVMTSGEFSSNSISSDSTKKAYGGALALESCTVNISGGEFTANFVKTNTTECYGGAIYILGSSSSSESNPHSISDCTFTANSAYQRGAAIYGAGSGYLNIKNCNFSNNTISNDAQGLQTGGTIYKGNGSSITILIDGENKFENTQVWNP